MSLECLVKVSQILSVGLTFIVGLITLLVLKRQADLMKEQKELTNTLTQKQMKLALDLKKADSLLEFGRRYDTLLEQHGRIIGKDIATDTNFYYHRFFELLFHEFRAWQKRHLDDDIYEDWLVSRRRDVDLKKQIGTMSYEEGWRFVSDIGIGNDDFRAFMNEIHKCGNEKIREEVRTIMNRHRAAEQNP